MVAAGQVTHEADLDQVPAEHVAAHVAEQVALIEGAVADVLGADRLRK